MPVMEEEKVTMNVEDEEVNEEGMDLEEESDEEEEWEELADGNVKKKILKKGQGYLRPDKGYEVFVHYTGRLHDTKEQFDSSIGRDLFSFKLGQGRVIKGWDVGVKTMKKGEKALFVISPEYGYGASGSGERIPPNSTLEFEVELFKWIEHSKVTDDGGVQKKVVQEGEGWDKPKDGSTCVVHLKGFVHGNDTPFLDTTTEHPDGFTFIHDEEQVPLGIEKAVVGMKKGEKVELVVEPQYGYGDEGNAELGVGPNEKLRYELELLSFQNRKEPYAMSGSERIENSEQAKTEGNSFFKDGRFSMALKRYKRALDLLAHANFTEEEKEKSNALTATIHANMAAVHMKKKDYREAVKACDKSLDLQRRNVKVLYRRATALSALQDHDEALRDITAIFHVDKQNADATRLKAVVEKRKRAQDQKDKALFARMLSGV